MTKRNKDIRFSKKEKRFIDILKKLYGNDTKRQTLGEFVTSMVAKGVAFTEIKKRKGFEENLELLGRLEEELRIEIAQSL